MLAENRMGNILLEKVMAPLTRAYTLTGLPTPPKPISRCRSITKKKKGDLGYRLSQQPPPGGFFFVSVWRIRT